MSHPTFPISHLLFFFSFRPPTHFSKVDRMVHKDSIIKDASPGNNRRCAEEDYDWLHDDTMNPPWRIKAVGAQVKFSHTSSTL